MIKKNIKLRINTALFLLALLLLMIKFDLVLIYVLIIFGVLSVIEFIQITKKFILPKFSRYFVNLFFITYLSLYCYLFFFLSNFTQTKVILYMLLLGCIASDIGGFVIGKLIKGPRLTKISPNKTYSGAIGSICFSYIVISIMIFLYTNNFSYLALVVSIITSISCQIGDLAFSFLKRKAKIKDTGFFLPGHGGILDRLDGILLGIPLGFFSVIVLI